jgi:hypothetical protein
MRCNDFDAHIDEMLSGILHPDASDHMRKCERCASHFRARATVQSSLRKLAAASATGPSRATDRAVMESYRRLQQRRAAAGAYEVASDSSVTASTVRLFTFPGRSLASVWTSRTWWSGAAAAAVVFAVFGSAIHLWTDVPTVSAPIVTTAVGTAPSASAPQQNASAEAPRNSFAANSASRPSQRQTRLSSQSRNYRSNASRSNVLQSEVASAAAIRSASEPPIFTAKATSARRAIAYGEASNYDSAPVTQVSASAAPVIRLASSGATGNVAQSASSTWPGYSNLMYCDPVVCSGPMQVVHIKVPVGQVKPNLGQTVGNAFVNAEVVIGPDGVARAIRVAN